MSRTCRSRRPWFLRPFMLFEKVSERRARCVRPKKTSLRLLSLEDRITPTNSLEIVQLDAVGYTGNTVAVRLSHVGTGTPTATLNWGDGTTVSLGSWSYATEEKVFTHTYSSTATFTVTATDTNISKSDSQTLNVLADVPPLMPVDGAHGLEFGRTATPTGNNPSNISAGNVRYSDGVVSLKVTDLMSTGYGMPWGHTRSWTNGPGYDRGSVNGNGWVETQLPSLIAEGEKIFALAMDGTNARTFDTTEEGFELFFGQDKLTTGGEGQYKITTPDGTVYLFNDFSTSPAESRGQFISRTDPNGNVTEAYSWENGRVEEIRRGDGAESWLYVYDGPVLDNGKQLTSVTWRVGSPGSYTTIRKVLYDYHENKAQGNAGDLKTVTVKDADDNVISVEYYRYYIPGEANGYTGAEDDVERAVVCASRGGSRPDNC